MTYMDPTGLSTTRDDYAYQLRTDGDHSAESTGAAAAMEAAAAAANNGYSGITGPQSPTVGTAGNEEALRQYENKEIGLVEYWSKLDFKSLFSDSLKELKSDVVKGINDTKDSFIDFYNENGVKGIAGAVLGMLSPVNVQEEEIVDPVTGKLTTIQTVCPCFPFLFPGATGDSIFADGKGGKQIAYDFYKEQGWSTTRINNHLSGIDFTKPVEIVTLPKGTQVVQYQIPGNFMGNYFAPVGTSADSLGINAEGRQTMIYTTTRDVTVLRSIASDTIGKQNIPVFAQGRGGGTQFFTNDLSAFAQ